MSNKLSSKNIQGEEDINFLFIIKVLWVRRIFITLIVSLFFFFGIIIAFLSPKKYTATSTFIPQMENSSSGAGKFSGLASLAGISLSGSGTASEIPPSLYPKIIQSVRFKRELLDVPLTIESKGNFKTTYAKFYEDIHSLGFLGNLKKYTFGLPGILINSMRTPETTNEIAGEGHNQLSRLTPTELQHFRRLEEQVTIKPDHTEGIVELKVSMPDALMAAQMTKAAEEILQQEVISYKIENAKEQLKFSEAQFKEKKQDFLQKQKELASFRDRNQNISSAMAMNQLQRLEADYNFSFNIYSEMAKQYEQAKLQVSKSTPVFSVINPVSIPSTPSTPGKSLIIGVSLIMGLLVGIVTVFLQTYIKDLKFKWKEISIEDQ